MTDIPMHAVSIGATAELPKHWATHIGGLLCDELSEEAKQWLQDRVLGLGHGVDLAHIRSPLVSEPCMGVYMANDFSNEDQTWLWLAVVIPEGNASRHLGWMAHLAACIRDVESRETLRECKSVEQLQSALEKMLKVHTHRLQRRHTSTKKESGVRASSGAALEQRAGAEYRLVVAILKEPEYVDRLLELFVEHDVRGSTILEARGMAEHLAAHMSLFAGFKSAFRAVGHSQVILTLVPNDRTGEVLEMVRIAAGGMETPGSGIAFAVDVPRVVGLRKNEVE